MTSNRSKKRASTPPKDADGNAAALAGYPGPVLQITDRGALRSINRAGKHLIDSLDNPAAGEAASTLLDLIKAAVEDDAASRATLWLPDGDSGQGQWLDTVVLPQANRQAMVIALDVTPAQARADSTAQRYRQLVEIAADFAWETGADGMFSFVSEGGALGFATKDLIGKHPRTLLIRVPKTAVVLPFNAVAPVRHEEVWVRDADQKPVCLAVAAVPVFNADGQRTGTRGVCRDVTNTRLVDSTDARRRVRERVVKNIIDSIRDRQTAKAMLDTAARAIGRALEAEACEVFLFDSSGKAVRAAAYGESGVDERYSFQLVNRMDIAEPHIAVVAGRPAIGIVTSERGLSSGAVLLWRAEGHDWTDENELLLVELREQLNVVVSQIVEQQKLETLSRFDELTGLVNRRFFYEELDTRLERSLERRKRGALMYVDLDNFKAVNDTLGHDSGDAVLVKLGDILRSNTRGGDLIGRLGGDEFAMWLDDTDSNVALKRGENLVLAARALSGMSASREQRLAISVGIAIFDPRSGESRDALVARADSAMYQAKQAGKGRVAIADPAKETVVTHTG
ncbi:MAG: sensor domain-containing diguanylate cyclase [Alphaproteobacteria bacterium]|nr:sensor domain-containing diguanylate cyclase [Alphaproteobacteria bacterium]